MRTLILGANGQLGRLVAARAPKHVKVSAYSSAVCDITDVQNLARAVHKCGPDLVINCAAYTAVDKAESERARAFAVNEAGVRNLVRATAPGTRLIHVSTDFVFDGTAREPYAPAAQTNPIGAYGASKLAGEVVLRTEAPTRSVIVRTAWLYAAQGQNFMNTMLRLMQSRDSLGVVADQVGTPTAAHGLADALWAFAERPALSGVYHWTDAGQASWYDFAREIQHQALALDLLQRTIDIRALTTADYPTPARRPAYSVLDKTGTWQALALAGRPWQDMLGEVLRELKQLQGETIQP